MINLCDCNTPMGNTGLPGCVPKFGAIRKLIFVPILGSGGTRNSIPVGTTFDSSYVVAKINNTNAKDRWYPSDLLVNIDSSRAETEFQTFDDNSKEPVQQGVKPFTGFAKYRDAVYASKLSTAVCTQMGVYEIDVNGSLRGEASADGSVLYPIQISAFDARVIDPKSKEIGGVQISYEYQADVKDSSLRMIAASEMNGVNMLAVNGLVDVYTTTTGATISTTSLTFKLFMDYGTFQSKEGVTGLVTGDIALYNVTDSASVTSSTFTELGDGVYRITFTAQTSGDEIKVTPTKNGYDFSKVPTVLFEIP